MGSWPALSRGEFTCKAVRVSDQELGQEEQNSHPQEAWVTFWSKAPLEHVTSGVWKAHFHVPIPVPEAVDTSDCNSVSALQDRAGDTVEPGGQQNQAVPLWGQAETQRGAFQGRGLPDRAGLCVWFPPLREHSPTLLSCLVS